MIVLYDKSATSFSNLGIGVLRDFLTSPTIEEVLNGLFNLEFEYASNGWLSEYLINGNKIKYNDQVFSIWVVRRNLANKSISVLAKHHFFDLEKHNFLEDVAPTDKTAQDALQWILTHAKEPTSFQVRGDCEDIASARYVRMDPIEAVYTADNSLLSRFGGELELKMNEIVVHKKRGSNLGLEIRHKKNIQGAELEIENNIVTRIMPIGKDGLLLPEKYVDSPLINNYSNKYYYKYSLNIGVDANTTEQQAYQLMRKACNELYNNGIDKPAFSLKIDFVELSKTKEYQNYSSLEKAHLGDTCRIYIEPFNLNAEARIVKTKFDCIKEQIIELELGNIKPNYITNNVNSDNYINNKISSDGSDSILAQAKESATNLINHPFNGNIIIDKENGNLYFLDTNDVSTAQKIWKFGLGGFGFSSTGINGPYEIALTQDGKIVADFITAGVLRAIGSYFVDVHVNGGNLLLNDDGTSQNASVKIQTPSTYTDYMIVGDNLDGKKLIFNLKDYTYETLENLRTECIIETIIPGETVRDDDTIYMLYLNAFEDELENQFLNIEISQIGVHSPNIIKTIAFEDGKIPDNFEIELYDEMGEITGITSETIINDIKMITYEVIRETSLSGNGLVAEIKADYDYTQDDLTRAQQIALGTITPTDADYRRLDVNKDGTINALDLLKISKFLRANIGINRPGKMIINTQDIDDNFVLLDGDGNKKISFGLMSGFEINDNNIENNESLWYGPAESQYGGLYMNANQTINLDKKVSECQKGIILVWYGFNPSSMTRINTIVAKQFISKTDITNSIYQHVTPMAFTNYQYLGSKLIYVYDNKIVGHANNTGTGTRNGITYDNTRFVLGDVYAT